MKYRNTTYCAILAAAFMMPCTAFATIPDCAYHLERAEPGHILTAEQMDINNNCIEELKQQEHVSEILKKIHEYEKIPVNTLQNNLPVHNTTNPINDPSLSAPKIVENIQAPALPTVEIIMEDNGVRKAYLRFENGTTQIVTVGTSIGDGRFVKAITLQGVTILDGKTIHSLGNNVPTHSAPEKSNLGSLPLIPMMNRENIK